LEAAQRNSASRSSAIVHVVFIHHTHFAARGANQVNLHATGRIQSQGAAHAKGFVIGMGKDC
jgi:hypothetical protein